MRKNNLFGKETIKLNCIDCLLLCYVGVVITSLCIHSEGFNLLVLSKWTICCFCYIIARRLREKQYISWGIIMIGVAESFLAVCQQLHWVESLHPTFEITGTFGNPGQLGIFMSLAITVTFGTFQTRGFQNRLLKFGLPVLILLFAYVLVLSDSRAGWIAAIIGCGFIGYKHRRGLHLRLWMRCVLWVIGILLAVGAYYYKQDSANGRLLIWRITADMIADAPATGHGIGSFPKEYMYYQADYFRNNPDSAYQLLAAIPHLLDMYAQYSFRYYSASKSLDVIKYAASCIPTSELWCDMGDSYAACNRTDEAMKAYQLSADMIPCRITPKYKLAMLYYQMGDMLRFRLLGEYILNMEIKIENTKVLRMRTEIKLRMQEM